MLNTLRNNTTSRILALTMALFSLSSVAQPAWGDVFNRFQLEARGDAEAMAGAQNGIGFHGRYFNLMMGGNLGEGFSYYYRQKIIANPGSVNFFDNTDFLYLNYKASDNWRLRFGKDALAVGGFEYDAPPIDEYMTAEYWNNFYCFQMAASVAYTTDDGRQTFVGQVSQSPYINSLGLNWDAGLLAFHVEWMGSIGNHVKTLWSTSMMMRERHGAQPTFMNLTMLGTQVVFDRWDMYIDLMHHALEKADWGKNYGWVARLNYRFSPSWTLFVKHSYEKNMSEIERGAAVWVDQLVPAGHTYTKNGLGMEYRPKGLSSVRLHAYAGLLTDWNWWTEAEEPDMSESLTLNVGATWTMDFRKVLTK